MRKAVSNQQSALSPQQKSRQRGKCHFCGCQVSGDYYCFGCDAYVCDRCDLTMPFGPDHNDPKHHRECPSEMRSARIKLTVRHK